MPDYAPSHRDVFLNDFASLSEVERGIRTLKVPRVWTIFLGVLLRLLFLMDLLIFNFQNALDWRHLQSSWHTVIS